MRLNRRGDILAGVGKAWWTDDLSVTQVGSDAAGWKTVASNGEVLDEQGFNTVCAGGGKWATWLDHRGPKGNFGPLEPAGIVMDIWLDGTVAWCPNQQAGMLVQGSIALSARACAGGEIVYALADRRVYSTRQGFANIPKGVQPFRAYVIGDLLLYHTHEHLVLQRFHEPIGIVVAEKPAYSPDMIRVGSGTRVVWCLNEGETHTAERAIADSELVHDLRALRDFPDPVPPSPPEPVPMSGMTDAQFNTLTAVRAKYGETLDEKQIGALLNEVAWIHRAEGVGMQKKDGGTIAVQPTTGTTIWRGMRFAGNVGQDVLGQASIGKCIPVRGNAGPADPNTFVAPVQPDGVVVVDPPPPPVDPPPTTNNYEARIHLLEQTVSRILSVLHSA